MTRRELHNQAVDMATCIIFDIGFHPDKGFYPDKFEIETELIDYLEKRLVETYEAGRVPDLDEEGFPRDPDVPSCDAMFRENPANRTWC